MVKFFPALVRPGYSSSERTNFSRVQEEAFIQKFQSVKEAFISVEKQGENARRKAVREVIEILERAGRVCDCDCDAVWGARAQVACDATISFQQSTGRP